MRRVLSSTALISLLAIGAVGGLAFDAYFSDAAGNWVGRVWEGRTVHVAVLDPDKGACGIAEFRADLLIFDLKTGAYIEAPNAVMRELGGIGSGLYFWVPQPGSITKVSVQIGSRADFANVPYGGTHVLGRVTPGPFAWQEGAWEYVDENVLSGDPAALAGVNVGFAAYPRQKLTARVDFEGLVGAVRALPASTQPGIAGRFTNTDTVMLILSDRTDERNVDSDQAKIMGTAVNLTVAPAKGEYGCVLFCEDIIVWIEDADENLNCNEIEYVPFWVIVNPGSWNPDTGAEYDMVHEFCQLMARGGVDAAGNPLDAPIRWYNIYDEPVMINATASRWIDYPDAWLDPTGVGGGKIGRVLFFAAETAVDSGVFEFNFGNLEALQRALGFRRFPRGTTIAFHYIDPNDWADVWAVQMRVGTAAYSEVFITNADGRPLAVLRMGEGWGGLYVKVLDGDANVAACCQDRVVVALCDPHNEDDCEYIIIDEISNNSGIFFTQSGIPLLPVWDAVAGYRLVFDDWRLQVFNRDTVIVRYNSVDYLRIDLNKLGDGNAND